MSWRNATRLSWPIWKRAAWAYIKHCGFQVGAIMMDVAIRRYAAHHGHASKYHHTLTAAWMHLVAAHAVPHAAQTFDAFIERHGRLLDKRLIERFYSREVLFSDCARKSWMEPDLRPFPEIA